MGNDLLHELTKDGHYRLRFDLQDRRNASWYWAEYSRFVVGNETTNYTMYVSHYTGNAAGDALAYSSGMMFSTYDRDNDGHPSINCAAADGGGFWYHSCAFADVNGVPGTGDDFDWYNRIPLKSTRMWLSC